MHPVDMRMASNSVLSKQLHPVGTIGYLRSFLIVSIKVKEISHSYIEKKKKTISSLAVKMFTSFGKQILIVR